MPKPQRPTQQSIRMQMGDMIPSGGIGGMPMFPFNPAMFGQGIPAMFSSQQASSTPRRGPDTGSGSILCGVATINGQPCRQKVLRPGERCYAHRGTNNDFGPPAQSAHSESQNQSQSSTKAPPSPVEIIQEAPVVESDEEEIHSFNCASCNEVIFDENTTAITKLELLEKRVFQCSTCTQLYHHKCLEHCTPIMEAKLRGYEWQCSDCSLCTVCKSAGEESQLLFCDACDRGYHMYCLEPEMKKLPKGEVLTNDGLTKVFRILAL